MKKPLLIFLIIVLGSFKPSSTNKIEYNSKDVPFEILNSDLVITEIMYNPANSDSAWEWIEIFNSGSETIDLSGFVIDDNSGAEYTEANIVSGIIEAGQSAILFDGDAITIEDFRQGWGEVNLIPTTRWSSLNNSGDSIGIWSSFEAYQGDNETQANVIEQVVYSSSGNWPENDGKASIYLTDLASDNNLGSNWALTVDEIETPLFSSYVFNQFGDYLGNDIGSPGISSEADIEAPMIICVDDVSIPSDTGLCSANIALEIPTATDNSSTEIVVDGTRSDLLPLENPFPVGETTITWVASDEAGNSSENCVQTIVVMDEEKPVIECGLDIMETSSDGNPIEIQLDTPLATDNCDGGLSVTGLRSDGMELMDPFNVGATTIVWKTVDASGNEGECVQVVEVGYIPLMGNDIIMFTIADQIGETEIDVESKKIEVLVPFDTDVTLLSPTISVSTGASVFPNSGTSQDFTEPVTYTVIAEDGGEQEWLVVVVIKEQEPEILSVLGFNLVDADTDVVLRSIEDGDIIDLNTLPTLNLNIQAVTTEDVESVRLELSGTQNNGRTENVAPYAFFGDVSGNYSTNNFELGEYALMATPYDENNLGGIAGSTASISFSFDLGPVDADGDGVLSDLDCDDNDPSVFPGAIEVCDGIDNNCDGLIDDEEPSISNCVFEALADLVDATYLMGSSNPSPTGPILRTEEGNRETYLKFDLSSFSGPITQAELQMKVASDPGNGTLEVFLGSHSNWTETNLNGTNKPMEVGSSLAVVTGAHSMGQTKIWNLNVAELTSGSMLTLIIKHSNGNDVAFASDETAQAPQLIVTSGSGGPIDADGDGYFSDVDCDDNNPGVHPEAIEVCDGIDNNCDGLIDDEDVTVDCDIIEKPADLIDATYLQGDNNPSPNGPILRTEEGNRETYLKFDLSTFNESITKAVLQMKVASDPGNGALEVFLGNHSNWTETGLNGGNKPIAIGNALAVITGIHNIGQIKAWNLDINQLSSGGIVTLIIKHSNGNDVAFASDETAQAPELIITSESSERANPLFLLKLANTMKITPNPAVNEVSLTFDLPTETGDIQIFDVTGRLVKTIKKGSYENGQTIGVQEFEAGLYFVKAVDISGQQLQKQMVIKR